MTKAEIVRSRIAGAAQELVHRPNKATNCMIRNAKHFVATPKVVSVAGEEVMIGHSEGGKRLPVQVPLHSRVIAGKGLDEGVEEHVQVAVPVLSRHFLLKNGPARMISANTVNPQFGHLTEPRQKLGNRVTASKILG